MNKELKILLGRGFLFDKACKEQDFSQALMQFQNQARKKAQEEILEMVKNLKEKSVEGSMVFITLEVLEKKIKETNK